MTRKPDIVIEDLELFRQSVGPIEPVFHDRIEPAKSSTPPFPRSTQADERQVLQDMLSDYFSHDELDTGEELHYCNPGLQTARRVNCAAVSFGSVPYWICMERMSLPRARRW